MDRNYPCKSPITFWSWSIGHLYSDLKFVKTRPSVNYAKDWLDHSFLFPGLVWPEKEFHFGCDHWGQSTTISLCFGPFSPWWRTTKRTTGWSKSKPALDQCQKTVFCKKCIRAHTLINNIFFTFFRGVTRFLNIGFSGTLCVHYVTSCVLAGL